MFYLLFLWRAENKFWAFSNCWTRVCHIERKETQSEEKTSGWHEGKAVLRGWLQAGPNSAIGKYREAGKETKWWRDYNILRQAIPYVICEGICLQIHSGYIFTLRFVLDHLPLSSQIGPSPEPNVAFILILSMQINLDCVGVGGVSTGGVGYWMSPILEEWSLELNVALFIRRVYQPTWSQDQRSNTFHHIKERHTDNCYNRCDAVSTKNIQFPFLFWI